MILANKYMHVTFLLQENGDSGKPITYLKVDVEGTELGMSSLFT